MGHREIEMRSEFEGSSECQSLQDVGARLTSKHKMKQSIWGLESELYWWKTGGGFYFIWAWQLRICSCQHQAKCRQLIGMTFCKKPLIADWTDGASFTLTTSNPKEDNFDGSSGCTFSFLMACNTSIFFLLDFGFRKSSICSLCHSNSMTYYFLLLFWWWMVWEGHWELGCQQIRVDRWYWL